MTVGAHRLIAILLHATGERAFGRLPEHDGNKQYDLRYDSLGGRDEP
jgi:hypothetical protein